MKDRLNGLRALVLPEPETPTVAPLRCAEAASGATVSGRPGSGVRSDQLRLGPEIYQSIGVEPIINCVGTFTIIGGSVHRPEVAAAMEAASRYFVQIDELAEGIGKRLALLTGAEWGMVSAGCAAALKHVTAACVAGGNPDKLHRIPDLTGFEKTEVIIPAPSFSAYDFAIQNIGVRIIRPDTMEELVDALSPRTAMIKLSSGSLVPGPFGLDSIARVVAPLGIPVLADAAPEDLTIPNVHLARGATVVAYSGGKVICGPQCAGFLLGNKKLLMSTWQASSPHHGPGRDNKVGREEMIGMLAAVEAWVTRDHAAEWRTWLSWLDLIARRVAEVEGVTTQVTEPTGLSNRSPRLTISWDPARLNVTGPELAEELAQTKPRIALNSRRDAGSGLTSVSITAFQMQQGDAEIVADRLAGVLSLSRSPKSTEMAPPIADISGRWDVLMEFASSESQHVLILEQEGNWIRGVHEGDFFSRELLGTIDGARVTLRSEARRPAATFIFDGTLVGGRIAGPLHMGEYLRARFAATRHSHSPQEPIVVPRGQPLAT